MFGFGDPNRSGKAAQRRRMRLRRKRRADRDISPPASGLQGELLKLHNNARPANYRLNAQLCKSAQNKANEMDRTDRMTHDRQWWKRIEQAGYDYRTCGENLGEGFDTAESVFRAWMNSPTHKKNIMNGKFDEIGFGQSNGYWCSHFGAQ